MAKTAAARERLAFALDVATRAEAERWIERLLPSVGVFKVGLELFVSEGPAVTRAVTARGAACFLDLKLHDIPKTVGRSAERAGALGVRYLTMHASAGREAIREAASALEGTGTTLLGVTVLTSQREQDLRDAGVTRAMGEQVLALADLALSAGAGGLVCSPEECAALRAKFGAAPTLVVPGIRPAGAALGDQARVATPGDAVARGASVLVVGRPIRDAADPEAAARAVLQDITNAAAGSGQGAT